MVPLRPFNDGMATGTQYDSSDRPNAIAALTDNSNV